ncbi:MAG: AmmeMemoRadiSam system radical SAM enzyme [Rhodospirillales bacterium]
MSDIALDLPPEDLGHTVPGRYWHLTDDGLVQCDLCPRNCRLREGQRGLCFVRAREGEGMVLTTYGRSSGFCIDPIEKKPLNHFLPGTPILSFGTAGCNLTCKFCQNWSISKAREFDKLADQAAPEVIARAAKAYGCSSVAFTYNDPVIFLEYAIDVAEACHAEGLKTVAVTAGYICDEPRAEFFRHMDAANVDLKAFTEDFYHKLCTGKLEAVKETLVYLAQETDVWFEITDLLIPGENDGEAEIEAMTQWIVENLGPHRPVHFTAFHPDWKMRDLPRTPPETLHRARYIARRNGLRYAYVGNIHDVKGQSTYCHGCGEVVIERDWHQLGRWGLTQASAPGGAEGAHCSHCGTAIAGHFQDRPGDWGRKRQPVRLASFRDGSEPERIP